MSEFDLLRNVTIGQYLAAESPLHHLDPRVKLLLAAIWLTAAILSTSLIGLGVGVMIILLGFGIGRVPIRYGLGGVRAALPFLALLALLQIVALPQNATGVLLWRWWWFRVTTGGLHAAALLVMRFALFILVLTLLSFTTRTTEFVHGIEHLLRPLQRIGLPAHELSLTFDIALRSVPILAQEAERLAKAQASRGADFGLGRGGPIRRAQQAAPLIVPLFLSALRRAERLALAMEARCYMGSRGRTYLIALHAEPSDWAALIIGSMAALLVGILPLP